MELQNILKTKRSIGILGVGAIGSVIAYHLLQLKSHELYYFSRTKKRTLNLIIEDNIIEIPVDIQTEIETTKTLDWLIVCLKEHQYQNAQHWLSHLISTETKIAVIRNGLNLKAPVLEFTLEDQILECMIDCPTQLTKTEYYHCQKTSPLLTIPNHTLAMSFKSLFDTANIQIKTVNDFKTESWKKLCESATLGGILCLYNDTCRIFKDLTIQKEYIALMHENIKVARADGANIDNGFIEKMRLKLLQYPATKGSSMLTDLQNGNKIELGAKNGIIVQLGKHYNVNTPINDHIVKQLS